MMNYPPLNDLQAKAGCRYLLVTTVAKRARQLQDDPEKLDDRKPVSVAVDEQACGNGCHRLHSRL